VRELRVNWVDLTILAVIAISALLAFMRGLVREALSIGSWIGAGFFAVWAFPFVQDRFRAWLGNPDLADPAAFGAMFVLALIVLSIVAGMVGAVVRGSVLGGIDRSLGIVYGIVRGGALVIFAYIAGGMIVTADHWPPPVLDARSLPYAYSGALWAVRLLPEPYRPTLTAPPAGRATRAEDLLHATPQGRAINTVARP
jgi:membrane protein required for colicin V production